MPEHVDVKYCRHCGQLIPLPTVTCPYCEKQTIKGEEQRECPFCGELIKAKAVKCRHCGEFVDGRERGGQPGQVIIERAIFTSGTPGGGIELHRPDGAKISLSSDEVARLGQPPVRALPGGRSEEEPPGEEESAQPPVLVQHGLPVSGVRPSVPEAPPAEREAPAQVAGAGEADRGAPEVEAQYECPSCRRHVFGGDAFCENCGRDLSLPADRRSFPAQPKRYDPVDYALLVGFGGPVGLLAPFPFSAVVAAAGIILGAWCLLTILLSGGRLAGAGRALGAIALGLFWLALICWSGGRF